MTTLLECCCNKSFFELFNDFIGHVIWPVLILILVLMYRRDISELFKRITKFKGPAGVEADFRNEVKDLQNESDKASESVNLTEEEKSLPKGEDADEFDLIRKRYTEDPKIGIMYLASEIEKESRILSKALNISSQYPQLQAFDLLYEKGYLTKPTLEAIISFRDLRNKIVHGFPVSDTSQLLIVFDSGITILKTLKAIPRHRQFVHKANIELYSDEQCTKIRTDVKGLIIRNITPGGAISSDLPVPSRQNIYKDGMEVSWAWNLKNVWNETWFKDPDSDKIRMGWSSSGEYIGMPIHE